jgi:two-component system sensor histidine kinase/response regulator
MVTAFGRKEVVKQAEKIGINAFLVRPVNQSLLFDTLMSVLGPNIEKSLTQKADRKESGLFDKINGARVLLVEDNILNQEVATEILSDAGAIVNIAINGLQAVEAVEGFNYDIVLMDLQMPLMGGYEATRIIRSNGKYRDLPIIAMTAHAMAGAKEECLAAGLNDYVSKPIEPYTLFSVICKWIKPVAAESRKKTQ